MFWQGNCKWYTEQTKQASMRERLKSKFELLIELKRTGIWLVDTNVFGWHITQKTTYTIHNHLIPLSLQRGAKEEATTEIVQPVPCDIVGTVYQTWIHAAA